jgi:hypothetical protein
MQMLTTVVFEWLHAQEHDIVPPPRKSDEQIRRRKAWEDLEEKVYPNMKRRPPIPDVWSHELTARTKTLTRSEPLVDAGIYKRFAGLKFEPESYRDFANTHGLLLVGDSMTLWKFASFQACLRHVLGLHVPRWVQEQVTPWRSIYSELRARQLNELVLDGVVSSMGQLILLGCGDDLVPSERLGLLIEHGCKSGIAPGAIDGYAALLIRPRNLMAGLALQTIRHLSGEDERIGVELLQCRQCGDYFKAGPGTGRRRSSKFCDRRCENAFRYAARMRGKTLKPR